MPAGGSVAAGRGADGGRPLPVRSHLPAARGAGGLPLSVAAHGPSHCRLPLASSSCRTDLPRLIGCTGYARRCCAWRTAGLGMRNGHFRFRTGCRSSWLAVF